MTEPAAPSNEAECVEGCGEGSEDAGKKTKGKSCAELEAKIKEQMDTEKQGRSGPKGLKQRFQDYRGDDVNHGRTILEQQVGLRRYLKAFEDNGCGNPPDGAGELAERPLPSPAPVSKDNSTAKRTALAAGGAVATVGAGYLIYRGVRMLPSLAPPLWWTLPANIVAP